jgi:DNA-binding MarR family transcriptional regulator
MSPAPVSGLPTARRFRQTDFTWPIINVPGVIGFVLRAEDYKALAAFRYAMRKFLRFSKEFLAGANLTPEQYEALLAIKTRGEGPGLNIRDLSERLQVKHHTAISLLNKLVDRKLVSRKRGLKDRREVKIKLTTLGDATLARLAEIHRREMRSRSSEMIEALRRLQK